MATLSTQSQSESAGRSGDDPKAKKAKTAPRKTRWWTYLAGIVCLVVAWPLIQYNLSHSRRQMAFSAMESGDPDAAAKLFEAEQKRLPQSAEIIYWLAVANRRAGRFQLFQANLKQAQELGYPQAEIERQLLLMQIQSATVSPQLEQAAEQLIQQSEKYTGSRMDLFVDEFYEARAKGYLANYKILDAELALDHWIGARPDSIPARLMRADIRERELNVQAAEREYREVLARAPRHFLARLQYGRLLLHNLKVTEAAKEFETCLDAVPQDVRAQLGLAECEYRGGEGIEEAQERLQKLLAQELTPPDRSAALLLLGETARVKKDYRLAIKSILEALQLSPTMDTAPYRTLSAAYAALNQRDEAAKYLKISQEKVDRNAKLIDLANQIILAPNDARLRFEQGNLLFADGQKEQAAAWWAMAIRFNPQYQAAHESLADYYASIKDSERAEHHRQMAEQSALATFNRLWLELLDSNTKLVREEIPKLAKYPALREPAELLKYGVNVVERKELERSAQGLGRLANNPQLKTRALTLLAEALYVMGNYNAAERAYGEVLAASPKNIVAHRGLQSIYFDLGNYDRMELHAQEVARIDPTDYRPHRHMGFLRREAESWEPAILDYKESLRRNPHQPTKEEVLLEMADCYVHVLKYQEALATLKDARPSAQKSYLEAQCLYATKKVPEAKKKLDASLEKSPDHAPSLLLRSDIALGEGDAAAARGFLERAVKVDPYDNNARQKYSTVLLRLNERDLAKKEADRAKELLDLHLRFSELSNEASQKPRDIAVRKELASLASQLGREDEARRWKRVVEGMGADPPPVEPQNPSTPVKALNLDKPAPFSALPGKTEPKKLDTPAEENSPKPCGAGPDQPEAAKEVFSGPQKGEKLPGFTLKTGTEEEKEVDVVKDAAGKPTLVIFVHKVTRPSVGMARVLGDYAASRKKDGMHVGVAFLTGDATDTKAWIKRASGALPKEIPLGIAEGGLEGPGAYGLNRNVEMTILVAKEGKVTANFALVQPSLQADGPKVLKEIVEVLGGGKVPTIEELMPMPRRERGKAPERKGAEKSDAQKKDG